MKIPSGKQPRSYGKLLFIMGRSTVSMGQFPVRKLLVYQRVQDRKLHEDSDLPVWVLTMIKLQKNQQKTTNVSPERCPIQPYEASGKSHSHQIPNRILPDFHQNH